MGLWINNEWVWSCTGDVVIMGIKLGMADKVRDKCNRSCEKEIRE